jgi:anti-sigma factor RsiW
MTKIAVGIGEEFPADDSKPAEAPDGDRRAEQHGQTRDDARCAARRAAYRKWREQRRQWKRQWRNEWRAHRRALRTQLRDGIHENPDRQSHPHSLDWSTPILWAVLGIIAAIAVVSFLLSHIFVVVGVVALLALFAAYYRGDDPFAFAQGEGTSPAQQTASQG